MPMTDAVLDGLDAVDWANIKHAYGPASDVPGKLRALLTTNDEKRKAVFSNFVNGIFHQETIYEATGYVIPFLIRMIVAPEIGNKRALLHLLDEMAESCRNGRPDIERN